eukprot:3307621-Rhodomonas_salina.2
MSGTATEVVMLLGTDVAVLLRDARRSRMRLCDARVCYYATRGTKLAYAPMRSAVLRQGMVLAGPPSGGGHVPSQPPTPQRGVVSSRMGAQAAQAQAGQQGGGSQLTPRYRYNLPTTLLRPVRYWYSVWE